MNNRYFITALIKKLIIVSALFLLLVIHYYPISADDTYDDDTYVDEETGITFTIPEGWKAVGLSRDDRKYAKEKFSTGESTDIFVFMSSNLYERIKDEVGVNISEEEFNSISQESFLGYRMSEEEAQALYDSSDDYTSISSDYISGVRWWVFNTDYVMRTYAQYINGNMIGFTISQLMSEEKNNQVKDVIIEVTESELLKEKLALNEVDIESSTDQNQNNAESLRDDNMRLLLDGIIWAVIGIVYYIIKKDGKKQIKCIRCGTLNDKKNKYCVKCGSKME